MLPAASHDASSVVGLSTPARSPLAAVGVASATVFLLLLVDAMRHPPGALDVETTRAVQRIDLPHLSATLDLLGLLTDSVGAIVAWFVACVCCLTMRWWLPLLGFLTLPLAGVVNEGVGIFLVTRSRPHLDVLTRTSQNWEERSFPSGHVVGAVVLYGFVWFLVGRHRSRRLRWVMRSVCAAIVFLSGFDRVWSGAHWPSDVVAAYALGLALLAALILAYRWAEQAIAAAPGPVAQSASPDRPAQLWPMLAALVRSLLARGDRAPRDG